MHVRGRSVRFAPGHPGDAKRVRPSTPDAKRLRPTTRGVVSNVGVLSTPAMAHSKASRKRETQALVKPLATLLDYGLWVDVNLCACQTTAEVTNSPASPLALTARCG